MTTKGSPKSILKRAKSAQAAKSTKRRTASAEELDAIFLDVGKLLRDGRSKEAEKALNSAIDGFDHSPDDLANLKRLLSFTLETLGTYKESLQILAEYEDGELLSSLSDETAIRVTTQLAISFNNLAESPKAITLLKECLSNTKTPGLEFLSGIVDIALSRVYRKLNEFPIARGHGEAALVCFRSTGKWLGMAEAYREIGTSFQQEGDALSAVENYDHGIRIIGNNSAPFMLGKLYSDKSGTCWFLRRPHEGIECLEKSIEFFGRTEHIINSVTAYNNLGVNLMLIGEWNRAEKIILRALELARPTNHGHIAGILDSLAELKLLRGEFDEAEQFLSEGLEVARSLKRQWYETQVLRDFARLHIARGDLKNAKKRALETIELSESLGGQYTNMARLALAEVFLLESNFDEAEKQLEVIESNHPDEDFYVLGSIQRLRASLSLANGDQALALHHLYRGLTLFESCSDLFNTAVIHVNLGLIDEIEPRKALRHLGFASEIFEKLAVRTYAEQIAKRRSELESLQPSTAQTRAKGAYQNSVVAQLLMVRLAEATASRELLFRELVAILQQESQSRKIIIAETSEGKTLRPFITHGHTSTESSEIVESFQLAKEKGTERQFARAKDVAIFDLRTSNAPSAHLLISPASGAVLNDGSLIQPLLRVVELGMDVISLRRRGTTAPIEHEMSHLSSSSLMPGFIHSSPAMTALVEEVYKIRSSDVTVLVTGESGTGKELVSRAIHTISNRKDEVFVPFNCTAVPKELAEGHLFGYRKGSFTGAVADSPGIIRAADRGTLFLDEIGDLPLDVQPKLLRFLQEGEVQPIGEKRPIKVDVRVIAATNMPLEEKVASGVFREDLYYRLNVIRLRVPPLRERRSEIPPIVNYYVNHYSSRFDKKNITITPQTIDLLMVCEWEGNVRQLCNEVQRVIARAEDNEVITPDQLSPELRRRAAPLTVFGATTGSHPIAFSDADGFYSNAAMNSGTLDDAVGQLEKQMIRGSLARNNWNISRVASELGLTRRGLYLKLARYQIEKSA